MSRSSPAEIERELYEERTVLRVLAMRRTLFLVPVDDVPMVHAAASRAVAETERKRTIAMFTEAGIGPDPAALLAELEDDRSRGRPRARRGDHRGSDGHSTHASARR